MESCSKCKEPIKEDQDRIMCDSCKDIFHYNTKDKKNCANVSTTEYRAIVLMKRDIIYFCTDCKQAFKNAPVILRSIEKMEKMIANIRTEVNTIKDQVKMMEGEIETCSVGVKLIPELSAKIDKLELESIQLRKQNEQLNVTDGRNNPHAKPQDIDTEEVIYEMMERQNRASNIIIFNINESVKKTQVERSSDDLQAVKSILEECNVDKNKLKIFRLGKNVPDKIRPIKVILNSPEDALIVLKNKPSKVPGIKIVSDQTKCQQEYFKKIKAQLNDLVMQGDHSKTIKFINNKPTIVNKDRTARQKN